MAPLQRYSFTLRRPLLAQCLRETSVARNDVKLFPPGDRYTVLTLAPLEHAGPWHLHRYNKSAITPGILERAYDFRTVPSTAATRPPGPLRV